MNTETGHSRTSPPSDLCFAYITCSDLAEAEAIGRALVSERLAACVNLLPGMRSLYWWQGRIEDAHEVVLIAKTSARHADALIVRVRALHRYTTPCVVFLPVEGGNPAYLDWLRGELRAAITTTPPGATTT